MNFVERALYRTYFFSLSFSFHYSSIIIIGLLSRSHVVPRHTASSSTLSQLGCWGKPGGRTWTSKGTVSFFLRAVHPFSAHVTFPLADVFQTGVRRLFSWVIACKSLLFVRKKMWVTTAWMVTLLSMKYSEMPEHSFPNCVSVYNVIKLLMWNKCVWNKCVFPVLLAVTWCPFCFIGSCCCLHT